MPGHYSISYSEADGLDFARKLHDTLEPQFVAWFDKNDLKPGRDWDAQFRQAIGFSGPSSLELSVQSHPVHCILPRVKILRPFNTCTPEGVRCKCPIFSVVN